MQYYSFVSSYIKMDLSFNILECNSNANLIFGEKIVPGHNIFTVLPFIQHEWLNGLPFSKIIEIPNIGEIVVDIAFDTYTEEHHLFMKDAYNPYSMKLEMKNYTFNLQEFINRSYDGIVISDEKGVLLLVNQSFLNLVDMNYYDFVRKDASTLVKDGIISTSVALRAIQAQATVSDIVKYPSGKEAMVTSTPLYNNNNNMILIVSNARDITELNMLHKELKETKKLVKKFEEKITEMKTPQDIELYETRSISMKNLNHLVIKASKYDLELLITGDTGVGKSHLAEYIHSISNRSKGEFVHINCSSIPDQLLESELFGYVAGAFTGASKSKSGLFEISNKGTIFLDEIGNMPLSLQAKLLNVIQSKKFYPIGGIKEVEVDIRIIAATNANLEEKIKDGSFREDLFYRLNVIPIRIPSLSERKEDLIPLITFLLDKTNVKFGFDKRFSSEVLTAMIDYDWPGNIRELKNFIERSMILSNSNIIEKRHIINETIYKDIALLLKRNTEGAYKPLWEQNMPLKEQLLIIENQIIDEAIEEYGSLKEASAALCIDYTTLYRKRKRSNNEI